MSRKDNFALCEITQKNFKNFTREVFFVEVVRTILGAAECSKIKNILSNLSLLDIKV